MCFEFQRVDSKQHNTPPLQSFSSVLRKRASAEWSVAKDAGCGPTDANGGRYIKATNRTAKARTTTLTTFIVTTAFHLAFLSALKRPFACSPCASAGHEYETPSTKRSLADALRTYEYLFQIKQIIAKENSRQVGPVSISLILETIRIRPCVF